MKNKYPFFNLSINCNSNSTKKTQFRCGAFYSNITHSVKHLKIAFKMAPKKNSKAIKMKAYRDKESVSQRKKRLEKNRLRNALKKKNESVQQKNARLERNRISAKKRRLAKTIEQRKHMNDEIPKKKRKTTNNSNESKQFTNYKSNDKLLLEAFNYDENKDYGDLSFIGLMTHICIYCDALKYPKESPGMCCMSGKIILTKLKEPPQVLMQYLYGKTHESKHFMKNIRKYNSAFQMTSFGATKIFNKENYLPTFKIQGQVYHTIGSLLPEKTNDPKFLQIYFIGDEQLELNQRSNINKDMDKNIIKELQIILHHNNHLINSFKYALEHMHSNDCKIVIKADRIPSGAHASTYNAPTVNDIAVIMVDTQYDSRDIVIQKKDSILTRVRETHRLYDPLQYPLLYIYGDDGYELTLMQRDPKTKATTHKKVNIIQKFYIQISVKLGLSIK